MAGYTQDCIDILNEELKRTDTTGDLLLPILSEIISTTTAEDRSLLCEKLLVEAKIFNR
jgi:hypothetical protein